MLVFMPFVLVGLVVVIILLTLCCYYLGRIKLYMGQADSEEMVSLLKDMRHQLKEMNALKGG